jgi:hypothetical protein
MEVSLLQQVLYTQLPLVQAAQAARVQALVAQQAHPVLLAQIQLLLVKRLLVVVWVGKRGRM